MAPDGSLEAVYNFYGFALFNVFGVLTPDSVELDIRLDTISYSGEEVDCWVLYEVDGYPLFMREEPPEGFGE